MGTNGNFVITIGGDAESYRVFSGDGGDLVDDYLMISVEKLPESVGGGVSININMDPRSNTMAGAYSDPDGVEVLDTFGVTCKLYVQEP